MGQMQRENVIHSVGKLLCSNAEWVTDSGRRQGWSRRFWCQTLMVYSQVSAGEITSQHQQSRFNCTGVLSHQIWSASLLLDPLTSLQRAINMFVFDRLNSWEHWITGVRYLWPQRYHLGVHKHPEGSVPAFPQQKTIWDREVTGQHTVWLKQLRER